MRFIKRLVRNIAILVVIGIILLIIYPDIMRQIYQFYLVVFGPGLCILLLITAALPEPRRRRRY
jgi:uncharacterized membrane protein